MENTHFVYALDCGTYTADGTPIRIFGHTSLKTLAHRVATYSSNAAIYPELCGALACDDKQHAREVESAVLFHTRSDRLTTRGPRCEIRLGTPAVLNFIETEMTPGDAFLGMSLQEYLRPIYVENSRRATEKLRQKPGYRDKERAYRQQPEVKAREKAYRKRYAQENPHVYKRKKRHNARCCIAVLPIQGKTADTPCVVHTTLLDRNRRAFEASPERKAYQRAYKQTPEYKAKNREYARKAREKKRAEHAPGQLAMF